MEKVNNRFADEEWRLVSMTGLGRASALIGTLNVEVLARSVNFRGLDIKCRFPSELLAIEVKTHKTISSMFERGRIDIDVKLTGSSPTSIVVDDYVVSLFIEKFSTIKARFPDVNLSLSASDLLSFPGVMQTNQVAHLNDEFMEELQTALKQALIDLKSSRTHEGALLQIVLKEMLSHISSLIASIRDSAKADVGARYERFKLRLFDIVDKVGINQDRLAQEFALLVERADFTEEIDRLATHTEHFATLCKEQAAVGRKLDFLCQEMFREVNTLLTKTCNTYVSKMAIDLKAQIEKVREHVQNIE